MDLKLVNGSGDLDDSTNEIVLVDGAAAIAQDLTCRLQTFYGEYFLDQKVGMPFFRDFFVKNPNKRVMNFAVRILVEETQGIKEVVELLVNYDNRSRVLNISLKARVHESVGQGTFVYNYSDFIMRDS